MVSYDENPLGNILLLVIITYRVEGPVKGDAVEAFEGLLTISLYHTFKPLRSSFPFRQTGNSS